MFVGLALVSATLFHSHASDDRSVAMHSGLLCSGTVEQFMCAPSIYPKIVVALGAAGIIFGLRVGSSAGAVGTGGVGGVGLDDFVGGGLPWLGTCC